MCMFVFIDADSWDLIVRDSVFDLQCMEKELHESLLWKETAIKNCHKLFSQKYTSSFKYINRTGVSWEVPTLYVFRSQRDKKNFWSGTLVLLYPVKLIIAKQNGHAK